MVSTWPSTRPAPLPASPDAGAELPRGSARQVRALGIDLGSKRIGIAVSDSDGTVATPIETVARSGDMHRDHRKIAELADEWEAEILVVGLPLSLDGREGPAAVQVRAEAAKLADSSSRPVELYDERLTTVTAEQRLREQGLDARARRRVVDQVAAAILLQAWLDSRT